MTKTVYGREERPSKEVRGFRENHENQEVVIMLTSIALCSCRSVFVCSWGKRREHGFQLGSMDAPIF